MSHYRSNLRDIEFNLFEVFGCDRLLGCGPFRNVDITTAREILREVDRMAREELAESFTSSDRNLPVFDAENSTVTMPADFRRACRSWMDAEWYRLELPEEMGGQPVPAILKLSVDVLVCRPIPTL